MTLQEITDFVCSKHGKSDSTTQIFVKDAARRMYEFVWQYAPWQDTLTYSTYTVTAGTRTVTLGSTVEIPLAVAYGDAEVQADRKSTRLNSSHSRASRMPSSA